MGEKNILLNCFRGEEESIILEWCIFKGSSEEFFGTLEDIYSLKSGDKVICGDEEYIIESALYKGVAKSSSGRRIIFGVSDIKSGRVKIEWNENDRTNPAKESNPNIF